MARRGVSALKLLLAAVMTVVVVEAGRKKTKTPEPEPEPEPETNPMVALALALQGGLEYLVAVVLVVATVVVNVAAVAAVAATWWATQAMPVICFVVGLAGLVTLFLPGLVHICLWPQDLKKKYGAEWAVVTGGSSGIGKSIVERLCQQGINVIIVAVPEKLLDETTAEMQGKYPAVTVTKVGADLSKPGFMEAVDKATKGKDIKLLFCNAGFMITGFFADVHIGATKANAAVNVTSHLELTHKYVNLMLAKKQKGAVFFTSSPAWMLPSPTAAMYAGTKAFVTHFGVSLGAELKSEGIDVCVAHPSPVRSAFYDHAGDGAEVNFFKSTAKGPEVLVGTMFACIGRLVLCNQGYFPKAMGMMHKLIDFPFLCEITANVAHTSATFISAKKAAEEKKKSK